MAPLVNRERGVRPTEWEVGTAEIASLLHRLGNPHRAFRAVHVVGSKGKGSVAARVAHALRASGLRVGLYMSPHVHVLNERVCLGGEAVPSLAAAPVATPPAERERAAPTSALGPVDDATLAMALHSAMDARDAAAADSPAAATSWFDVVTAAAFVAFARARVDWAIVEAGMGGARDSTAVLRAPLCVLTNVHLEHVAQLGGTRVAIAREKAGIVTPGARLVLGLALGSARADDAALAAETEACARGAARVVSVAPVGERALAATAEHASIDASNDRLAALALRELCALEPRLNWNWRSDDVAAAAGARGAATARAQALARLLPARLETMRARGGVRLLLDGAHVPHSVAQVVRDSNSVGGLLADGRCAAVVLGIGEDKEAEGIVRALAPLRDAAGTTMLFATALEHGAVCAPPGALAALARADGWSRAEADDDPERAIGRALALAAARKPPGDVLVTGSLKLGAAARRAIDAWNAAEAPRSGQGV
jgi:dihydrofolate synthase/folylpolyglutamate synthase